VQKHVKGVGMNHDPSSLGHLIVWDTVKKAYRTVDSHKVTFFKSGTTTWGRSAHD
jgi:hypothetical protein